MKVFNGKEYVNEYIIKVKPETDAFYRKNGRKVTLAVLIVGDSPAALSYIKKNAVICDKAGVAVKLIEMEDSTTAKELVSCVKRLNADSEVDGVLIQLPLPVHVNTSEVLEALLPLKDVDGVTGLSAAALYLGKTDTFVPNTPLGVMAILEHESINVSGKRAVVLGRSNIVGKPMAMLLMQKNATVTICHSKTKDIASICREADILVSAIGRAHFVTSDMVKDGAVVIDIGTNFLDGKMVGDVDFESVAPKTSFITPVPNGCGPVTVCMLIDNTLKAAGITIEE